MFIRLATGQLKKHLPSSLSCVMSYTTDLCRSTKETFPNINYSNCYSSHKVNVALNKSNGKVICDAFEQSSVGHIYAIGDMLDGKPELTPVAIQVGVACLHSLGTTTPFVKKATVKVLGMLNPGFKVCLHYGENTAFLH